MDDVKLHGKDENEVDSLVQTVRIFSNDVGMDFGIKNVFYSQEAACIGGR